MKEASEREQAKPAAFLNAWKDAVLMVGAGYFSVTTDTVGQATHKEQLAPNLPHIFEVVGALSHYERVFMLSLCQFYCDSDVRDYCDEKGLTMPTLTDIADLDHKRLTVITRLMENYTGW